MNFFIIISIALICYACKSFISEYISGTGDHYFANHEMQNRMFEEQMLREQERIMQENMNMQNQMLEEQMMREQEQMMQENLNMQDQIFHDQEFSEWSMDECMKSVTPFEHGGYDMDNGNSFNDSSFTHDSFSSGDSFFSGNDFFGNSGFGDGMF